MGKTTINGSFSIAMLNYQRVLLRNVNPGIINHVYGCLIGGIPFKYQMK